MRDRDRAFSLSLVTLIWFDHLKEQQATDQKESESTRGEEHLTLTLKACSLFPDCGLSTIYFWNSLSEYAASGNIWRQWTTYRTSQSSFSRDFKVTSKTETVNAVYRKNIFGETSSLISKYVGKIRECTTKITKYVLLTLS